MLSTGCFSWRLAALATEVSKVALEKLKAFMGFDEEEDYGDYEYGVEENRALSPAPVEDRAPLTMPAPAAVHQIVSIRTNRFDEASQAVDELKAGRTVVLNVQAATVEVTRRVIDFVSGAVYARDGHIAQIATGTYLIAPHSVDVRDETRSPRYF